MHGDCVADCFRAMQGTVKQDTSPSGSKRIVSSRVSAVEKRRRFVVARMKSVFCCM